MAQDFSLTPFDITRTEKVAWRFPSVTTEEEILEKIISKSQRSFLRVSEGLLTSYGITWELKSLTLAEFEAWLPYYQSKMSELDYDILANSEWYQSRAAQGKTIEGLFMHQGEKMVGSGIFVIEGTNKATFAFKASERLDLSNRANASLGSIIDFFFIREMVKRRIAIISAGKSRNAFGVINSLGYLDYKMKFGYRPTFPDGTEFVKSVPLNEKGAVVFYGKKADQIALYAFKPQGSQITFEQARFGTPELPFIEVEY